MIYSVITFDYRGSIVPTISSNFVCAMHSGKNGGATALI